MIKEFQVNIFSKNGAKQVLELLNGKEAYDEHETESILYSSFNHNRTKQPASPEDFLLIDEVFSKLDKKSFKKHFTQNHNIEQLHDYVTTHRGLFEEFLNQNRYEPRILKFLQKKLELFKEYVEHIYENGLQTENNVATGMLITTIDKNTLKSIVKKHPQCLKEWDIEYYNNASYNIVQYVALYNPEIYEDIKELYPEKSLYENRSENFIFMLRNDGHKIFEEEIRKIGLPKVYEAMQGYSDISHKTSILNYLIESKDVEEWTPKDLAVAEMIFTTQFNAIWCNDTPLKKYQELYCFLLERTPNSNFIENAIYFSLNSAGLLRNNEFKGQDRNKTADIVDKIIFHASKNNLGKIDFLDLFEKENISPEFWTNTGGIADKIMDTLKSRGSYTKYGRGGFYNLFIQPIELLKERNFQVPITDVIETLQKVTNKVSLEMKQKIVFTSNFNEDAYISVYLKEDNTSRHLFNLTSLTLAFPYIEVMSDFSFKEIFKKELPRWSVAEDTPVNDFKSNKLNRVDKIIERIEQTNAFKEIEDVYIISCNFFKIVNNLNEKELFEDGRFDKLFKEVKFNLEEMLCHPDSIQFLFRHRDKDFSKYGLSKDSAKVLEAITKHKSTSYLPELREAYDNNIYRLENGDTPLHEMISTGKKDFVIEMALAYPEFNNVLGKNKKLPIEMVLSKLKVCKTSDKLREYGPMFKTLIELDLDTSKEKIIKIYNDCEQVKEKLNQYAPNWEILIQKNLMNIAMSATKPQLLEENDNNEWKL